MMFLLTLFSCGDSGDKTVPVSLTDDLELHRGDSIYTIKEGGLYFQVTIPSELMAYGDALMKFNSSSGVFHIRDAAQQIELHITPEIRAWQEVLDDKQRDALFTIQWVEKTESLAVYNRLLPDGSKHDQMLICVLESNAQRILVCSSPEGEYTEGDIQKMKSILTTLKLLS
jgi:hypothetical protein